MSNGSFRVLIAGGGVAGLEAVLALRDLARDRVEVTLLSPVEDFVYTPMATGEPFGRGHATHHPLADIARDLEVQLVRGALTEVDVEARVAVTDAGDRLPYDALLIAVGARSEPALQRPLTWTPQTDPELFGGLLRDLEEGYVKRVAFIVPSGVAWALPAYELALMTAWEVWGMGQDDVEVTVYTHEEAPLGLFGVQAGAAVRQELEEAGVYVETGVHVTEEPDRLILHPGERPLEAQRVVALPRAAGPAPLGAPWTRAGSSSPTCTAKSLARTRSGRPGTRSPSRSSRAGSPHSRPMPRPSRSPPPPVLRSSPGRTSPFCAG